MISLLSLCVIVLGLGVAGITVRGGWARPVIWATSILLLLFGIFVWAVTGIPEDFSAPEAAIFCTAAAWPSLGCAVGEVVRWRFSQGTRKLGTLIQDEN